MGIFRKKKEPQEIQEVPEQHTPMEAEAMAAAGNIKVQEMLSGGQTPFAEYLYSPGELPEQSRQHKVIRNKVMALSNLHSQEDVDFVMTHIDDLETNYKLFTPKRKQTVEMYNYFDEIRLFAYLQAQRSTGEKDRDRALLTTISTFADKPTQKMRRSVFGKMREALQ